MTATDLVRQKILDGVLERMTAEEMRDYVLLSSMNRDREDVLAAIKEQGIKMVRRKI